MPVFFYNQRVVVMPVKRIIRYLLAAVVVFLFVVFMLTYADVKTNFNKVEEQSVYWHEMNVKGRGHICLLTVGEVEKNVIEKAAITVANVAYQDKSLPTSQSKQGLLVNHIGQNKTTIREVNEANRHCQTGVTDNYVFIVPIGEFLSEYRTKKATLDILYFVVGVILCYIFYRLIRPPMLVIPRYDKKSWKEWIFQKFKK